MTYNPKPTTNIETGLSTATGPALQFSKYDGYYLDHTVLVDNAHGSNFTVELNDASTGEQLDVATGQKRVVLKWIDENGQSPSPLQLEITSGNNSNWGHKIITNRIRITGG